MENFKKDTREMKIVLQPFEMHFLLDGLKKSFHGICKSFTVLIEQRPDWGVVAIHC